jgi:hypothetical protein
MLLMPTSRPSASTSEPARVAGRESDVRHDPSRLPGSTIARDVVQHAHGQRVAHAERVSEREQ